MLVLYCISQRDTSDVSIFVSPSSILNSCGKHSICIHDAYMNNLYNRCDPTFFSRLNILDNVTRFCNDCETISQSYGRKIISACSEYHDSKLVIILTSGEHRVCYYQLNCRVVPEISSNRWRYPRGVRRKPPGTEEKAVVWRINKSVSRRGRKMLTTVASPRRPESLYL